MIAVGCLLLFFYQDSNASARVVAYIPVVLGLLLLTGWAWVRIFIMTLAAVFISYYLYGILSVLLLRREGWQWEAMALTVFSPLFALCAYMIHYLSQPHIKNYFSSPKGK